ncbi:glycosyltransferase family 2 protein [Acetobacterium malicum]|uniref:glycosyltransferase family 2 protein n=1 Tax=Acetobacterium malicum TaxID=52692 RepID=UPI00164C53CD|nr:glycosyltransferase family 2 protein [Acetobacterium malicum]
MKKICAVVVTYNRKVLLKECLDALINQTFSLDKIYLIDNASTDGTKEEVMELCINYSVIEYHYLEANVGGAGGFSFGMKLANEIEYDWIWIMDDDTIPERNCLEMLMGASNCVDDVSFLASSVYSLDNLPMNVPGIALNSIGENGYSRHLKLLDKKMVEIESATFVSILINGKAARKVGLPCAFFFIWGDDVEYTLRLTRNYAPAYVVGDSKALHKRIGGANLSIFDETNESRIKFNRYSTRNTLIVHKEYFGNIKFAYEFIRKVKVLLKLVFSRTEKKGLKIQSVMGGLGDFILKRYDVQGFNNRMN